MRDQVQAYMDRPKRYENVDGTSEMFFGLMLLGFALASSLEAHLPEDSTRWAHGVVVYGATIPALGLGFWLRKFVKNRWTWRRTGYVGYRRGGASWWTRMTASFLVAALVAAGAAYLLRHPRWHAGLSLSGIGMLAVFPAVYALWIVFASREHLWKWLILLFMMLGLLAIGWPVRGNYFEVGSQAILFVGLAWLGSGAGTLYSYIRHTEPAAREAE